VDVVLAAVLITGALGGAGAWFLVKQEAARLLQNHVRNGGFEKGADSWLPFVTSGGVDSRGVLDRTDRHSGAAAIRFDHASPKADGQWGSLSQRISRLRPRTFYAATFWALVSRAEPKPVFLTADAQWADRTYVGNEIAGWREYRHVFNTGDSDFIDLRFVIEAPGTVWIDDVALRELR
jgi:hypothetical protein